MALRPMTNDQGTSTAATADLDRLMANVKELPNLIKVAKEQAPTLQIRDLLEKISKQVGIAVQDLHKIFNALENIRDLNERLGSFDLVIDRLSLWVKPELAKLIREKANDLNAIVNLYGRDNSVTTTFKAQRLTYLREKLFSSVEIVTDARPIFDASGEAVVEFVVTHSLVITSYANNRQEKNFYAVDNADLLSLRKACDRAFLKARALKDALGERWPTEVLQDAESQP